MKRFLLLTFIFIGLPLLVMVPFYIVYDPYSVLYTYDDYNRDYQLNLGYKSTEMFKKHKDRYHYNSFILGSSRCMGINPADWVKHLDEGDSPYTFNASGERIKGVLGKIKYLTKEKVEIKHALILLDPDLSFLDEDYTGYLYVAHPETSDVSWFQFHKENLESFLTNEYFTAFIKNKLFNNNNPRVLSLLKSHTTNDTITNHMRFLALEAKIAEDENYYTQPIFERSGVEYCEQPQINEVERQVLEDIKTILESQGTAYSVIINPTFHMSKFAPEDVEILRSVFGGNKVYDFSGKNKYTESVYNYYENSHFNTVMGDSILNVIYR